MIDPITYGKFLQAEEQARQLGLSLVEMLDRRRLLLTSKLEHDIAVNTLESLLRRLDQQSPNKLMAYYWERIDGTPNDMFIAVKMWLETVIRNQANNIL